MHQSSSCLHIIRSTQPVTTRSLALRANSRATDRHPAVNFKLLPPPEPE
jgi:hypothetical protein